VIGAHLSPFNLALDADRTFAFNESVRRRLRQTIVDLGLVDHLGDDWTIADLELRWG